MRDGIVSLLDALRGREEGCLLSEKSKRRAEKERRRRGSDALCRCLFSAACTLDVCASGESCELDAPETSPETRPLSQTRRTREIKIKKAVENCCTLGTLAGQIVCSRTPERTNQVSGREGKERERIGCRHQVGQDIRA